MKSTGVLVSGLAAVAAALAVGACSPGTADCDANTLLVTIKCGEAVFTGGALEITRPSDGKSFSKSTTFECPGEDYVLKVNVGDYAKGDRYSLSFTPAITGATPFTKDEDAVGACLPWTVTLPAFTQGSTGVDAAVMPAPGDDASAQEQEAGTPSLPGDNKENGTRCAAASECKSGFCADGVCCNSECEGACKACNQTASPGICSNVAKGTKPTDPKKCEATEVSTCGQDGTCDGEGACAKYPDGTLCESGTCSGPVITGRKECQAGSCAAAADRSCAPFACNANGVKCFAECANNDQCAPGKACDGQKSCGKKSLAAECSNDAECVSGTCTDGFCCNARCNGSCESCGLPGKQGQCTAVAKGAKDPRGVCKETDISTCGTTGTCDGARGCSSYEANAVCKAASCAGTTFNATAKCDGAGMCVQSTAQCGAFACTTAGCKTTCAGDSDCVGGRICKETQCVAKAANGSGCGGNNECTSGFCADGVCCNSSCDGACKSCGTGTCTDIQGEDPGMCSGTRTCSGGCKLKDKQPCSVDGDCVSGTCRTYYLDQDGDMFGRNTGEKFCGGAPPTSYILATGDCCDTDNEAYPGHEYRPVRRVNSCGTGDFNCDGATTKFVLDHGKTSELDYRPLVSIPEGRACTANAAGTKCDIWMGFYPSSVPDSKCGMKVTENKCDGPPSGCYIFNANGGTAFDPTLLCL